MTLRPARPLSRATVTALAFGVAFALAAPSFAQRRRARAAAPDATSRLLGALHTAAGCPSATAPNRVWCIAADGYATGTAAPLPPGDAVLLGFTVELVDGQPVESAIRERVSLASLALHPAGGSVSGRIQSITPSDADESRQMGEAVASLALVFKGQSATAAIDAGMARYLATLPGTAAYAVRQGPHGWLIAGASSAELRRVGDNWVAVEIPASGRGVFVSLFTDRFAARH